MVFLQKLSKSIDRLNSWVGSGVGWVSFIIVIVVFTDVVMRYVFNRSYVFVRELEWQLFSFIFLMGAGYTLLKEGHVRVDVFYQKLSARGKAWVNLLGVLFLLLPGCFLIISTSAKFTLTSWLTLEGSSDPGGIPFRFIIKSAIPLGFTLVALQGISIGIKSFLNIKGVNLDEKGEL